MIKRCVTLLALLSLAVSAVSCGKRSPTLTLLVWEGYADPSFVRSFEEQNHCRVSASYMTSSDELVAKLRGGSARNYDVISPSSDVATMISTAGLAAPLALSKLPSYNQLSPKLTSNPRFPNSRNKPACPVRMQSSRFRSARPVSASRTACTTLPLPA